MTKYDRCACHSKVPYHKCCEPYHNGIKPETALALMRSRYCAYAMKVPDYIIDTTHPQNPTFKSDREKWKRELLEFSEATRFDGLKICEFVHGDEASTVTFTATLQQQDIDASFTEKSEFRKIDGRWYYLSGAMQNIVDSAAKAPKD